MAVCDESAGGTARVQEVGSGAGLDFDMMPSHDPLAAAAAEGRCGREDEEARVNNGGAG